MISRHRNNSRKSVLPIAGACAGALLCGFTAYQISVPDIETSSRSIFRGFDELERLGAYVVSADGEKLGNISKGLRREDLGNEVGAGSPHKTDGLFNEYSRYGSPYRQESAFNDNASRPPAVVFVHDGDIYSVGLLTTNGSARTRGQRINPYLLKAWLKSD